MGEGNAVRKKDLEHRSCFGLWTGKNIISIRVFYRLFQIKLARDELYSQRCDTRRIRFLGLSIKLFGE